MKLNSTGIESSPEKMVSVSAYGPGPRPITPRNFTRIRDAVAALPIACVVLNEAVLLRCDNTSNFDGLRSRQGQAEAILVAYDVMALDGQDVRPEPLEERRKRLARLLSRSNKAMRQGIQLSEATPATGRHFSPRLRFGP